MKKLSDICSVITSGQIMSRVSVDPDKVTEETQTIGKVKVIVPKAISNGCIEHSELGDAILTKEVDSTRITKVGDIVIKLSTPYDAACIDEQSTGLVVTSFCAIISGVPKQYCPEFLTAYLNTSSVTEMLRKSTSGLTIPLLRVNDLKALQIPDVEYEMQQAAVEILRLNQKKRVILESLLDQCDKLQESVVMKAVNGKGD